MSVEGILLAGIFVLVTFNAMRQMERWLHRHIFKVGWLLTRNFDTTTLLYYTFFLPGIVVNQFVRWLVAGLLDVRADAAISLPQKQEIGELNLNFIQINTRGISSFKLAIIKITPFIAGLVLVLLIAEHIFDISDVSRSFQDGTMESVTDSLRQMLSTTDFWLWTYILFTISNTMTPDFSLIRNYTRFLFFAFVALIILLAFGVGQAVIDDLLSGPIANGLNLLSTAFIIIIVLNFLGVVVLAIIENVVEYITGASAIFKGNEMKVMSREEARIEREKKRELERKRAEKAKRARQQKTGDSLPSVYKIALAIPAGPNEEHVTVVNERLSASTDDQSDVEDVDEGQSVTPTLADSGVSSRSAMPPSRDIRFNTNADAPDEEPEEEPEEDDYEYDDIHDERYDDEDDDVVDDETAEDESDGEPVSSEDDRF